MKRRFLISPNFCFGRVFSQDQMKTEGRIKQILKIYVGTIIVNADICEMYVIRPIIQILTGALLILLVTNDFLELLIEYLFGASEIKAPITFSPGGWEVKYWMMDHAPAFDIYQFLFMATGFVLVFAAMFQFFPRKMNMGIVGGLLFSALLVLLFPTLHYITEQTPKTFMFAQLAAGRALVPAMRVKKAAIQTSDIATYIATALVLVLVGVCLLKSTITLRFAIFPLIGVIYLLISNRKKTS